jgi:hypothetical protein
MAIAGDNALLLTATYQKNAGPWITHRILNLSEESCGLKKAIQIPNTF